MNEKTIAVATQTGDKAEGNLANPNADLRVGSIVAWFQPQYANSSGFHDFKGSGFEVDVTGKVLALSLTELHEIEDDTDSTNDLVSAAKMGHEGPHRIEVIDEICRFFDVDHPGEITEAQLSAVRAAHPAENPKASDSVAPQDRGQTAADVAAGQGCGHGLVHGRAPVMTVEQHANVFYAYLARLSLEQLRAVVSAQEASWFAAANYGNSGQLQAQEESQEAVQRAMGKMLGSDVANIESIIGRNAQLIGENAPADGESVANNPNFFFYVLGANNHLRAAFDRQDEVNEYAKRDARFQVLHRSEVAERFPDQYRGTHREKKAGESSH